MADIDGIYSAKMTGSEGQGLVIFIFSKGTVIGVDLMGGQFDGSYSLSQDGTTIDVDVTVKIPPNTLVIQGASVGSAGLTYNVPVKLPSNFGELEFIKIDTPLGPVNVKFECLRALPAGVNNA